MSEDVEIFLSDKAFIGIVISSIEVYKKECLGILLGVKTKDQIIVEHAIPFQAVSKRTFTEVKPNWRKNLKVNEIIPQIVHLEKLAYFHSHPQFGENRRTPSLSKCDKESIEETEIEIVAAINEAKRENWWRESRKELHASSADKFL